MTSSRPQGDQSDADQLAVFEVEVVVIDHPTRHRCNCGAMASNDARAALEEGVAAFQAAIRAAGFEIARTGYGVRAVTP